MEKIFDIAKDSEQKWGVIAQGIDGNFKEVEELKKTFRYTNRKAGKMWYTMAVVIIVLYNLHPN